MKGVWQALIVLGALFTGVVLSVQAKSQPGGGGNGGGVSPISNTRGVFPDPNEPGELPSMCFWFDPVTGQSRLRPCSELGKAEKNLPLYMEGLYR